MERKGREKKKHSMSNLVYQNVAETAFTRPKKGQVLILNKKNPVKGRHSGLDSGIGGFWVGGRIGGGTSPVLEQEKGQNIPRAPRGRCSRWALTVGRGGSREPREIGHYTDLVGKGQGPWCWAARHDGTPQREPARKASRPQLT